LAPPLRQPAVRARRRRRRRAERAALPEGLDRGPRHRGRRGGAGNVPPRHVTSAPVGDVDALLATLQAGAHATDAEDVDLLAHGLQCAALLAEAAPDDPELQVAGLVHDVGTALWPDRPRTHARPGAATR